MSPKVDLKIGGRTKYEIKMTNQFRKSLKLMKKQGRKLDRLERVVTALANDEELDLKYRNHKLVHSDYSECHIEPDWLLIYLKEKDVLVLTLVNTGSHSEVF